MKRILTATAVLFVAVAMLMGCASSGRVKKLETMVGNLDILNKDAIGTFNKTAQKVDGIEKELKGTTAKLDKLSLLTLQISDHLGFVPEEETSEPITEEAVSETTTDVDKDSGPIKEAVAAKGPEEVSKKDEEPKARVVKAEGLEGKLAALTEQVARNKKEIDRHNANFSDLQRRLAEVEDEIQPVYLWTAPFKTNSAKLTKAHKEGLDKLAIEILAGRVELIQAVVGYADPRGRKEDNEKLSKERAQSCIDYLVKKFGAGEPVKWFPEQKWFKYFTAEAGGETARYGNFRYSRRVCFKKR